MWEGVAMLEGELNRTKKRLEELENKEVKNA